MIKDTIKTFIGSHYSAFNYPIVVNSYGRSGSTVLTKSIIKSAIKTDKEIIQSIACRSISQSSWELDGTDLKDGIVYKTHDYPPKQNLGSEVRMLYTYANPVDVVLSLLRIYDKRGEVWMRDHYNHLRIPYTNFKDIIREDQLQLERHLESWLNEKRFPIAFIKYESMWEHEENISDFLGFNIKLPPFRERKAKRKDEIKLANKIGKTYKSLITNIESLDDFFINLS